MKNKNAKNYAGKAKDGWIILDAAMIGEQVITLEVDLNDVFGIPYGVLTGESKTAKFFRKKKPAEKYFQELLDNAK